MCLEEAELCMEFRKPEENIAAVPLLWKKEQPPIPLHPPGFLPSALPCRLQSRAQILCLPPRYFCYISTDLINTALSLWFPAMCYHLASKGNDGSEKHARQGRLFKQSWCAHGASIRHCFLEVLKGQNPKDFLLENSGNLIFAYAIQVLQIYLFQFLYFSSFMILGNLFSTVLV